MSHSLYANLIVPSAVNSYSQAIEYMENWFLKRFAKGFFKDVHVDGKHISDDFKNYDIEKKVKIAKPNLAIIPSLVPDYDRQRVDAYPYGIDNYVRRCKKDTAFFQDIDNELYLGWQLEIMRLNFTFRARFQTKAQQIDVYKFMRLVYRIGFTQGKDETLDFHMPYRILIKLAQDAGFEVDNNRRIKDPLKFLAYLNSHSNIPIICKFRPINGKIEFFVRMREMYVHIACPDELQLDDGERAGMLNDNYTIEMTCTLDIPSPKAYMYFTQSEDDQISSVNFKDIEDPFNIFSINLPEVPAKNKNGWDLLLNTDYESDILKAPVEINFEELIKGDNDLYKIIEYNHSIGISPAIFIDFTLRNDGKIIPFKINWNKMIITIDQDLKSYITNIFIYLDTKYINDQIIAKTELEKEQN